MDLIALENQMMAKICSRSRGWPVDHSPGSFEWRMARARAWRVLQRVKYSRRISIQRAMYE